MLAQRPGGGSRSLDHHPNSCNSTRCSPAAAATHVCAALQVIFLSCNPCCLWMEPPPHAWRLQSVAEAECRRAAAAAEQAYRDAFREEGVAPEEGALAEEHQVRRDGHLNCHQRTGTVYTCRWVGKARPFP